MLTGNTSLISHLGRQPDAAILHLGVPLINDPAGRVWLLNNAEEVREWLAAGSESASSTLLSELQRLASEGAASVQEIMDSLGLN